MVKRAALYMRVSTADQHFRVQEVELKEYAERRGWRYKVYSDLGHSGLKENRPGLTELLTDVRRRRVDVVCVWALDRLARSLRQLLALAEEFKRLGVDLVSYKQNIDTSSPSGCLTYQVLGAVAEFERALIGERVKAGLTAARNAGRHLGRPAKRILTKDQIMSLKRDRRAGTTFKMLSERYGITVWMAHTLCRRVQQRGV